MRVFLNPGHAPNGNPDPGACGNGLRESDVVKDVVDLVEGYLVNAGVEVVGNLQDDSLSYIVSQANSSGADIFISVHCNAFNGSANGTEIEVYDAGIQSEAVKLANCVLSQIVNALGTLNRGLKSRPGLAVIRGTDMPAILVELAFIDHAGDAALLRDKKDEFARAIARGVTDYQNL